MWASNGLSAVANHNIQVAATGTHAPAATASKVDYDAVLALKER